MDKKRVRTLLRVSSKQQLHDDDIPVQRAEAEEYIKKRPDWQFDKEYIEKAVSAYKNGVEDREVLQQILADAKQHQFDVLLAYMSDRIGRQEEYSFYVAALNQVGIEVWTIKDGQLKTEEHVDKLLNYIRFWQNEGESKKTSMRVKDNQRELVKSGKFVGGKAPFGYKLVPSGEISNHGRLLKKLVIVEEDAAIVRKIYEYAIYQGMGYEKISKQLNKEGIKAVTTDKWKSGTIASILKNPIYMGYFAINRRINHGSFTRLDRKDWIYSEHQIPELVIIPQPMWEKAQEIRESRKDTITASKERNSKAYEEEHNIPFTTSGKLALIGLACCKYCGARLKNSSYSNHWTTKAGDKKSSFIGRYKCPNECSPRYNYSQAYLEDSVFEVVEGYMEKLKGVNIDEELQKMKEQQKAGVEKELKAIIKERNTLKADIATLEEKIPEAIRGDYYFSVEKLSELIKDKESKLEALDTKEKAISEKLSKNQISNVDVDKFIGLVPNWREVFASADIATKRMLLSSIIDRIDVGDGDISIKFKIRLDDLLLESGGYTTILYTLY
jgi:DNA invertase Pin-like site-specific DNA recombinase